MILVGAVLLAGIMAISSANPTGVSCFLPHEKWSSCQSPCVRSCDNEQPACGDEPCVEGCFCEEPYVRSRHGHCVLFGDCGGHHGHHGHHHGGRHGHHFGHRDRHHHGRRHRKCGHNEKFKRCKRTCEPTCKRRHPHDCHEPCFDFGCQCDSGFVRDRHGDCIPYDLCPSRKHHCGRNERWSNETNLPERKCQQPRCKDQRFPKHCPRYSTNGGCVCKDTYVRDNRGRCVKKDHCRHRSGSDSRHWDSWDSDSDSWGDRSTRSWSRSGSRERWWDSGSRDWDSDSWDSDSDSWGDRSSGRRGRRGRHGRHGGNGRHRGGRHGRRGRHHGRRHSHGDSDECHCRQHYARNTNCWDYCHSDGCQGDGCKKRK